MNSLIVAQLMLVGVSGFFLPLMLKNPLAKIEMNGRLVAPSYTHPAVSIMKNSTTTGNASVLNITMDNTNSTEEEEYSLYADIAEVEYDYDEELYQDNELSEPRSLPNDPVGHFTLFVSNVSGKITDELEILGRNFRIALALLSFFTP